MQWCNCDHNNYNLYSLDLIVNEHGNEGRPLCHLCGQSISNDDMILLLLKEVKRLSLYIKDFEVEKMERDRVKMEEATKEEEFMRKIQAESERFNILDL